MWHPLFILCFYLDFSLLLLLFIKWRVRKRSRSAHNIVLLDHQISPTIRRPSLSWKIFSLTTHKMDLKSLSVLIWRNKNIQMWDYSTVYILTIFGLLFHNLCLNVWFRIRIVCLLAWWCLIKIQLPPFQNIKVFLFLLICFVEPCLDSYVSRKKVLVLSWHNLMMNLKRVQKNNLNWG